MYKRICPSRKRWKRRMKGYESSYWRKNKAIWMFTAAMVVSVIAGFWTLKVSKVFAAMEDPQVEAAAAALVMKEARDLSTEGRLPVDEAAKTRETPLIAIDPGHGGEDAGCMEDGILEKDLNLDIALRLRAKLTQMGFDTLLIRGDDSYVPKEERVEMANRAQADIYVSIHQNTYEDKSAAGMELWYDSSEGQEENKHLAQLLCQELIKNTQAQQRELKGDSRLYVTNNTDMPSCLIETGFLSNTQEKKQLITEEYRDKIATGIAQGIHYYFEPKTMYLTFDDGPSPENTNRVLDILKKKNLKATFFLVGENVKRYPEVAKRIVQEGHAIGVHCNVHDYNKIYASVENYIQDFEQARSTIREVTGVDTKMFRFPGGSVNAFNKKVSADIVREMTGRGYVYFDWNASLEDAVKSPTQEALIENAKSSTLGRKKVILLAHDVVYETGMCLEELIDQLPEYRMEVLTQTVESIQFHQPE